jgi:hypothetical protein
MTFRDSIPRDLPTHLSIESNVVGEEQVLGVRAVVGVDIQIALGDIQRHPPRSVDGEIQGEMGGDHCRASGDMSRFGTISFYAGNATYSVRGRCNQDLATSPVLVSNNHVIARSDAAPIGEAIWTPSLGNVATLHQFLPIRCNSDIAFGLVTRWPDVQSCRIRTIGSFDPNARPPRIGELIVKHGARTGYRTGRIEATGSIKVNGVWHDRIFRTSPGFGCSGDSGSAVIGPDRVLLGLFSWGEQRECEDDPRGWFFPLTTQSLFDEAERCSAVILA